MLHSHIFAAPPAPILNLGLLVKPVLVRVKICNLTEGAIAGGQDACCSVQDDRNAN
jgi:hypothetical protein